MLCDACGRNLGGSVSKARCAVVTKLDVWANKMQIARAKTLFALRELSRLALGAMSLSVAEVDSRERQTIKW